MSERRTQFDSLLLTCDVKHSSGGYVNHLLLRRGTARPSSILVLLLYNKNLQRKFNSVTQVS